LVEQNAKATADLIEVIEGHGVAVGLKADMHGIRLLGRLGLAISLLTLGALISAVANSWISKP
jgi:hypothetical protein